MRSHDLYLTNMLAYTAIHDIDIRATVMGDHEYFIPSKYWNEVSYLHDCITEMLDNHTNIPIEECCYVSRKYDDAGKNVNIGIHNFVDEVDIHISAYLSLDDQPSADRWIKLKHAVLAIRGRAAIK